MATDQDGRWGEITVREERGGCVAGSDSVRNERCWRWAIVRVVIEVQGRVRSHSIMGLEANPRVGFTRTGPTGICVGLGDASGTGGSGEHAYGERE